MKPSPLAGKPAAAEPLLDVPRLVTAYYTGVPDPCVPAQRVAFGTSGHRGSALENSFNERHVLAVAQAICDYRARQNISGPLFLGTDKFSVGRTVQSWEIEAGAYKLGSISETTGIADVFYSQHLNYLSEGKITASGLRPDTFLMSRKRRDETEVAKADFNWETGQITLGKVTARRTEALPAASQDMASFMYQLSLAPPSPGRLKLPITNGANLEIYELEVLPEENLETPLGTLKTLPIRQVRRPGEESIEFWLAADYRYLPVKIRFLNREGEPSGEQIVSEIKTGEE